MKNAANREIPASLPGYRDIIPYAGPFATPPPRGSRRAGALLKASAPGSAGKVLKSVEEAIEASGLKDGMTISFHHALRNGDRVMNMVVQTIAKMGIKNLTLAPSSFLNANDELIPLFEQGVITAVQGSGARGKLGHYLTTHKLAKPCVMRPHGGRGRAIEAGELHIDVAFIAAPACDRFGNINGVQGPAACGSLGYGMMDARHADTVVAITDNLVDYPLCPISIPQDQVDFVVPVEVVGDPRGIATGALRGSKNPRDLIMARYAATIIERAGYYKDGFSMQLGAGAAPVSAGLYLREAMLRDKITASFAMGGILGVFCDLQEEGLIRTLLDVQSFDQRTIESLRDNPMHQEVDASFYASIWNKACAVHQLDYNILGATEVDVNFNVNVLTDSNGIMMGAIGGHPDTAAGAKCSIICAPLLRGRLPMITDAVQTICTPGETIDAVVTERGIAINPRRQDLIDNLKGSGLPLMRIEELRDMAYELVGGKPEPLPLSDDIVAVVEYRDGTVLDVIRTPAR